MNKKSYQDNQGVAALLSIVILGALVLVLTKESAFIGRADLDMANNDIHSSIARSNAESCLEEAIGQIRHDNLLITKEGSLDLNGGTCFYQIQRSSDIYEIFAEGQEQAYLQKIEAKVLLSSGVLRIVNKKSR